MLFACAKHATVMPGCCQAVAKVFKAHYCARKLLWEITRWLFTGSSQKSKPSLAHVPFQCKSPGFWPVSPEKKWCKISNKCLTWCIVTADIYLRRRKTQVPVCNTLPLPALSHPDLFGQHNQFKRPLSQHTLTIQQAVCVCVCVLL